MADTPDDIPDTPDDAGPDFNAAAFQLLADLRGGVPAHCDYCRLPYTAGRYPVPEEAGEWACNECEARWQAEDKVAQDATHEWR